MADSNVLMPRDYIQRLLATWQADTGMVSAPPIGSHPHGFWARDRMRLPQHLPGALAIRRRHDRARLRAGQDPVLSPRRHRSRRRLARARRRSGRGRGLHQDHARQRPARAAGRCAVRAAARRARARATSGTGRCAGRGCGATASARSIVSRSRSGAVLPLARRRLRRRRHRAFGHRRRRAACSRSGTARKCCWRAAAGWHLPLLYPLHAMLRDADAAGAVVRGLARGRLRLARQRHERRRRRAGLELTRRFPTASKPRVSRNSALTMLRLNQIVLPRN